MCVWVIGGINGVFHDTEPVRLCCPHALLATRRGFQLSFYISAVFRWYVVVLKVLAFHGDCLQYYSDGENVQWRLLLQVQHSTKKFSIRSLKILSKIFLILLRGLQFHLVYGKFLSLGLQLYEHPLVLQRLK